MCPLGERVRNGALLSLLGGGKLGPTPLPPTHASLHGSHPPALRGAAQRLRPGGSPAEDPEPVAQRRERRVRRQAHPWDLGTQSAGIHAAGVTHPSLATGASRRAPRGRGAGSCGPGRPRAARGGKRGEPSPGVEVTKLLIPRRGSERAPGRLGRSFERVDLRTLQEARARNPRLSSEAANICKRETGAEPGRAAASLPPEPRRRPGRTRPRSERQK